MAHSRPTDLSEKRRALLDALLQAEGIGVLPDAIPVREVRTPTPLSYAQESLWVSEQMMPATSRYNIATSLRLTPVQQPQVGAT